MKLFVTSVLALLFVPTILFADLRPECAAPESSTSLVSDSEAHPACYSKLTFNKFNAEGYFTFWKPAYLKRQPADGIDSYVGEFQGAGDSLSFDYGLYGGLEQSPELDHYKEWAVTIDGKPGKMATYEPMVDCGRQRYSAAVFIPNVDGEVGLVMTVDFKSKCNRTKWAKRILNSIRFK